VNEEDAPVATMKVVAPVVSVKKKRRKYFLFGRL